MILGCLACKKQVSTLRIEAVLEICLFWNIIWWKPKKHGNICCMFCYVGASMRQKTLKNTNQPKSNITNLTVLIYFKSKEKLKKNEIEKDSSAIFAIFVLDN